MPKQSLHYRFTEKAKAENKTDSYLERKIFLIIHEKVVLFYCSRE